MLHNKVLHMAALQQLDITNTVIQYVRSTLICKNSTSLVESQ